MKIIKKETSKVYLGGQLWEECEKCGNEPVYTRFDLCERCSMQIIKNGEENFSRIQDGDPFYDDRE